MGYILKNHTKLPIDKEVEFYFFIINGQFKDPFYDMMLQNFDAVAKSIGDNAIIAKGTDPEEFTESVSEQYFGKDRDKIFSLLPALVITNAHPDEISADTLRLIVPLGQAPLIAGGWTQFFKLLSDLARQKNYEFLNCFQPMDSAWDKVKKYVKLEPGFLGVKLKGDVIIDELRARVQRAGRY
jgi:hypothetical protein